MLSHKEAQELHECIGQGIERTGDYLVALDRALELASVLVSDSDPDNEPEDKFTWNDWQSEEEELGTDGRVGVYWIEISDPNGEEYAVIVHRTVHGQFPLDGPVAKEKEERAQKIVDALNAQQ